MTLQPQLGKAFSQPLQQGNHGSPEPRCSESLLSLLRSTLPLHAHVTGCWWPACIPEGAYCLPISSSLAKPVNFPAPQWANSHLQWGSGPFPHLSFLPPSALGSHADFPDIIDYSLIMVNTFYINLPSLAYCVISISWMDPDHFKYFTSINSFTFCNNLVHGILLLTLFFRWRKFVRLDNSHSNWGFNFNVKN